MSESLGALLVTTERREELNDFPLCSINQRKCLTPSRLFPFTHHERNLACTRSCAFLRSKSTPFPFLRSFYSPHFYVALDTHWTVSMSPKAADALDAAPASAGTEGAEPPRASLLHDFATIQPPKPCYEHKILSNRNANFTNKSLKEERSCRTCSPGSRLSLASKLRDHHSQQQ